jgi:hypothetical protein
MAIIAKSKAVAAICSTAIAIVGWVALANAQQPSAAGSMPPQGHPGPGMGADMMQRGMERGRMGMDMGQEMTGRGMMGSAVMSMMMGAGHTEGRLAFIKAELKITDTQMPQWNAFADAVRGNVPAMNNMHQSMTSQHQVAGTLPERLAMEDKALSAHVAAFKKVEDSLTKLYEVLSPEQRKVADGIVLGPMGMPMGMM